MAESNDLTTEDPFPWLDQSGLAALLAGSLVVLITFFTSYSHVDLPAHDMRASRLISKSEFLSSLPPWRRWLARLNWHPTLDVQINAIESRQESERLRNETAQLKNETEQLKNESEQLKIENARLAALESKLDSLLLSADSSSPIPPATDCN